MNYGRNHLYFRVFTDICSFFLLSICFRCVWQLCIRVRRTFDTLYTFRNLAFIYSLDLKMASLVTVTLTIFFRYSDIGQFLCLSKPFTSVFCLPL